jgi:hypothetical protein
MLTYKNTNIQFKAFLAITQFAFLLTRFLFFNFSTSLILSLQYGAWQFFICHYVKKNLIPYHKTLSYFVTFAKKNIIC